MATIKQKVNACQKKCLLSASTEIIHVRLNLSNLSLSHSSSAESFCSWEWTADPQPGFPHAVKELVSLEIKSLQQNEEVVMPRKLPIMQKMHKAIIISTWTVCILGILPCCMHCGAGRSFVSSASVENHPLLVCFHPHPFPAWERLFSPLLGILCSLWTEEEDC